MVRAKSNKIPEPVLLRGKKFTSIQLQAIKDIVKKYKDEGRTAISKRVCKKINWKQPNGNLKDMACREVLRGLNKKGLIKLPKSKINYKRGSKIATVYTGDTSLINLLDLSKLNFTIASKSEDKKLWNCLIEQYHYLKSSTIVGRQMKYLIYCEERPVACIGWGDSVWHMRDRDNWIGWNEKHRTRRRHLIINNVRFLILPWVKVPNLASYILGKNVRDVVQDWSNKYSIHPVLLETFVDPLFFAGTCYKAANWIDIGCTAGYAKSGNSYHNSQTPKKIFVYPVCKKSKNILMKGRRR